MIPPIRPPELPSFHPTASPKRPADVAAPSQLRRPIALIEVIICSGFPSQLALAVLLGILGLRAVNQAGELSFAYVVTLSLTDTAVLIACIFYFLGLHHEPVLQFFLGPRTRRLEVALGVALTPLMVLAALAGVAAIQQISPALHNVPENPLQALLRSPAHVLVFTLVAMVAGGLREELQRAFILRRFEQHLGGALAGAGYLQRGLRTGPSDSGLGRRDRDRGARCHLGGDLPRPPERGGTNGQPRRVQRNRDSVDRLGYNFQRLKTSPPYSPGTSDCRARSDGELGHDSGPASGRTKVPPYNPRCKNSSGRRRCLCREIE